MSMYRSLRGKILQSTLGQQPMGERHRHLRCVRARPARCVVSRGRKGAKMLSIQGKVGSFHVKSDPYKKVREAESR